MAYALNPEEQEQQNQAAQEGPQQLSQGAMAPGGAQQPAQGGQKRSFSNIGQYLQQNKPQSAKLGEKVGNVVGQKISDAQTGLQQGQEQFNQQLQQNQRTFNADLVNQAGQDPTKLNQEQFGQLKSKLSGNYEGPQGLDENIFNKAKQAADTANLGSSEAGRKQLLQQVQNPRRASAGVTSLNNLLLQNNPQAQQQIIQKQEQAKQLQQSTEAAKNEAAQKVQAAQAQNKQVADQTREAFLGEQGFVNKFKSGLDEKAKSARAEADKRAAQAQALLKGGTDLQMTPEARQQALADIGLSSEEYDKISRAYNPMAGKDFGFSNLDKNEQISRARAYEEATGKQATKQRDLYSQASLDRAAGGIGDKLRIGSRTELLGDQADAINDYYNQQNKFGKYADQMAIGSRDLSDLATVGSYNQDPNALRQQVATRDDLARQQAFNSLLGVENNFLADNDTLGTFNKDLVNFDRLRAGLK